MKEERNNRQNVRRSWKTSKRIMCFKNLNSEKFYRVGGVAQVIEYLSSMCEGLSSNPRNATTNNNTNNNN
jgi:hypothetical protein